MKKKIFGLAAMMFTAAALVACGEEPVQSDHKHAYTEEVVAERVEATCQAAGKKVMKCECGETKEQTIAKKAHTYVDAEGGKAATCTEDGEKVQKCSACNTDKKTTIEKLGHDYVALADQTGATKPTCTVDGTEKQECSRCHEAHDGVVAKLGHNFVDDDDQTAAEAASCTFSGTVLQHCDHEGCTETKATQVTATGHTFAAQGEAVAAVEDKEGETVKGYNAVGYAKEFCSKDNVTRVSWDAKQVTTRCNTPATVKRVTSGSTEGEDAVWEDVVEPNMVVTEDEGVQFWGRAIGNAQILDDSGSSSANSHIHEPKKEIEGSYFEYKLNLTAPLESMRLTANLKPANYLSRNDIWRASGAENDWTPGYQEGVDGKMHIVNDWRYVLFIDGQQIQLDRTVDTKLINANSADWYTLPMKTMNLAAGEHTVKLVMAGGYRHTFYKFGFETGIQHEHAVNVGEKAENSALRTITCKCGKLAGYELKAAEAEEGSQKAPVATDKNTRLGKSNIFEDTWTITGASTGMYEVYLNAQCSAGNASKGYWNSATAVANGDTASNNGATAELQAEYKYKVAVGTGAEGEELNFINLGNDTDTYAATGLAENAANWTNKALATIPLNSSAATLTIKNMNNGYALWVFGVRLVKVSDFVY